MVHCRLCGGGNKNFGNGTISQNNQGAEKFRQNDKMAKEVAEFEPEFQRVLLPDQQLRLRQLRPAEKGCEAAEKARQKARQAAENMVDELRSQMAENCTTSARPVAELFAAHNCALMQPEFVPESIRAPRFLLLWWWLCNCLCVPFSDTIARSSSSRLH